MKKILVIIFVLLCNSAFSQELYGIADFSRRDAYPTDRAIAIWDNLDPGESGDKYIGWGDLEYDFDVDPDCGYCPHESDSCDCAGTSRIDREQSIVYKNSSALKITVDASSSLVWWKLKSIDLEANSYYQLSFKNRGAVGLEDMVVRIVSNNVSYYSCSADTWGGAVDCTFSNMSSSWTSNVIYITTGGVAKPNTVISFRRNGASQVFYIDDVKIVKLNNTTSISSPGGFTLAPAVTSDPVYMGAKTVQSWAGQLTKRGIWGDGTDDYLTMSADNDVFDASQTGNLSVCVEGQVDSRVANASAVAKDGAAGQRSWFLYDTGTSLAGYISKDGGTVNVSTAGKLADLTKQFAGCMLYSKISDGGSLLSACINHEATCSNNALAVSPIFNSTSPIAFFDRSNGLSVNWLGSITRVGIYNKYLTQAKEYSQWVSPYFPGVGKTTDGFYVTICTQAASHAMCGPDKCVDGTPNRCRADTQWMPIFEQQTEMIPNNSFETNTGTPESPAFTGWTATLSNGDGTATLTDYYDEPRHGSHSARIKLTGTTSYGYISTACLPASPLTTYFAYAYTKLLSGNAYFMVDVTEYSDAACTMNVVPNYVVNGANSAPSWQYQGGSAFTTAATTNFVKLSVGKFMSPGHLIPSDLLIDTVSLKPATHFTPWVHMPTAAGVTYNSRDYRVHNPLSDMKPNGRYAYQDGFCAGVWVWTDWKGNDGATHYIIFIPGTVGNNNRWSLVKDPTNTLTHIIYDSAAGTKIAALAATSDNWRAGTMKYVEACSNNAGTIAARHFETGNNTWYTWTASGAGTGIWNGQMTDIWLRGTGVNSLQGYLSYLVIGSYNVVWPMYGFNRRPTQKPY